MIQEKKKKLDGIWFMGGNCQVVQVPVISHLAEDMDPARDEAFIKEALYTYLHKSLGVSITGDYLKIDESDRGSAGKYNLQDGPE